MSRWLVLGLAGLVLGTVAGSAATFPFLRGPYAGAPSADSVVISWATSISLPGTVEVSAAVADVHQPAPTRYVEVGTPAEEADGQVDVRIGDLSPATSYVYRVTLQSGSETITSPIGRFRTAPLTGAPVTFAVLADTQWQWEGANRLAPIGDAIAFDAARLGGFDFILHAGDLVETPHSLYWNHWFSSFEAMLLAAPLVPVLGNHEKNSRTYYDAFSLPPGAGLRDEQWWALRWGDAIVVGLDTNATRADRILAQQDFARDALSGPERHKFVMFHHPVWSSDAYHGSGWSYDVIYHPIFVEAGVDIVFNGHAHNYERIERDGVTYLVLGGGGAVPRALAPERVEGSTVAVEGHNFYARVAATPDEIAVEVVAVAEASETTFTWIGQRQLDAFTLAVPPEVAPPISIHDAPPPEPTPGSPSPGEPDATRRVPLLTALAVGVFAVIAAVAWALAPSGR